jgi:hypothetical protein
MSEALRVDTSECRHVDDLPAEPFTLWGGEPAELRALRRLGDGAIRSAAVSLPAGWTGTLRAGAAVTQIFVRSGGLTAATQAIGANGLVVLGDGRTVAAAAGEATELLVIFDHACSPAGAPEGGLLVIADTLDIEPIVPVIDGKRLDGFFMRVIWVNPESGADTMLLHVPGGFRGGGPNFHPVNEEIFCLAGDIQPDETRPMRAGSFLWNPVRSVHGFDEVSAGGSVLLEWHDGPWALTYAPEADLPARYRA